MRGKDTDGSENEDDDASGRTTSRGEEEDGGESSSGPPRLSLKKKHDSIPRDFKLFVTALTPKKSRENKSNVPDWKEEQLRSTKSALLSEKDLDVDFTSCLGEGEFGSVFRGMYQGEPVAVKRVNLKRAGRSLVGATVAQHYLDREISLIMNLKHKHLCRMFGVVLEPKQSLLLVMEFLSGGNLRQYWQEEERKGNTTIDWKDLAGKLAGAAEGLVYLHDLEIIHRDIKTENLALSDTSPNARVVLLDFGLARKEAMSGRMTIVGTDSFMSPEVIMGEEYSVCTDIFSMGVVIAEMACRCVPNTPLLPRSSSKTDDDTDSTSAGTRHNLFLARRPNNAFKLNLDFFKAAAAARGCPTVLIDLACRCLAYETFDRPATDELVDTLRACSVGDSDEEEDDSDEEIGTATKADISSDCEEHDLERPRAESAVEERKGSMVASPRGQKAVIATGESKILATAPTNSSGPVLSDQIRTPTVGISDMTPDRKLSMTPTRGAATVKLRALSMSKEATRSGGGKELAVSEESKKKKKKKKKKKGNAMAASLGLDLKQVHAGGSRRPQKKSTKSAVPAAEIISSSEAIMKRAATPSSRRRRKPKRRKKVQWIAEKKKASENLEISTKSTRTKSADAGTPACASCMIL
eukprot:g2600.t1